MPAPPAPQASPVPESASPAPAIRVDLLESLLAEIGDGAPELRSELINEYLSDAPDRVTALAAAAATGDRASVAAIAHQLRSGSATLGALRLAELLAAAEQGARSLHGDLLALADPAVAEFGRVSAELTALLDVESAAEAAHRP